MLVSISLSPPNNNRGCELISWFTQMSRSLCFLTSGDELFIFSNKLELEKVLLITLRHDEMLFSYFSVKPLHNIKLQMGPSNYSRSGMEKDAMS